ncbi:MAG: hypothetical protein R2911_11140 [Caldilineaceae bacterium]
MRGVGQRPRSVQPFGAYDPLQIANLTAHTAHMTGEPELYQCLELVTSHPRRTFGLATAITPGASADLVVVDAQRDARPGQSTAAAGHI